jgi:uncharacterized protein (DUF433 family)
MAAPTPISHPLRVPESHGPNKVPKSCPANRWVIVFRIMSIGSMIELTPDICGGRPRVAGTRVPVHRIACYHQLGYSPEEMLGLLNSLSLSQIYAALAYALANPEEIQEALREEEDAASRLSPEHHLA